MSTNPKYCQRMSELLDELIKRRREQVKNLRIIRVYPAGIDTKAKQALCHKLGKDEVKALSAHEAVRNAQKPIVHNKAPGQRSRRPPFRIRNRSRELDPARAGMSTHSALCV